MATSLSELIQNGKWEKALFTSYVFSPSFFETEILRDLRQSGCQQIHVLVDTKGYRDSLVERRTSSIGQDIRLIPVYLPNGVFHPKLAYLASKEVHVLAVGSGNLTFGGFGRNLEVLEVLTSGKCPEAFDDFANFLNAFETRLQRDMRCPDINWIREYRNCVLEVAKPRASVVAGQPRILHSVDTSIVDQLEGLLGKGASRRVTIMSPYFDPDAGGVRRLVQALGCERLQIAASPRSKATSFPVMSAKKSVSKIEAVWSTDADEKRALIHAKWIEVNDTEISAVLTGSVNATRKALCSTDNIEVGVLRVNPERTQWTNWTKAEFPSKFEPCDFAADQSAEFVAFATAHSDGSISGRIIGITEKPGTYDAKLTRPTGETISFDVTVREDGTFDKLPRVKGSFLLAAGLQIVLRRAEIVARGWVHIEDILSLPRLPKLNIPSFLRMLRREQTEDDEVALLEYFAVSASRHWALFSEPIGKMKSTTAVSEIDDLDSVIDLSEIKPGSTSEIATGPGKEDFSSGSGSLDRMFSRLRHVFLAPDPRYDPRTPHLSKVAVEVDDEADMEPPPEEVRVEDKIEEFDRRMRELVEEDRVSSKVKRGLYVIWFEILEYMRTVRSEDFEDALAFMREWTGLVGTRLRAIGEMDALEQHLVSCLAVMSVTVAESARQLNSDFHDTLEHFYCGEVPSERAHKALLVDSIVPYRLVLKQENGDRLNVGLNLILAAPTVRQQLELFIDTFRKSGAIDERSPLFHGSAGDKILERLRASQSGVRFLDAVDERPVCPECFKRLTTSMEQHLSRSRIACCECGALVVRRQA